MFESFWKEKTYGKMRRCQRSSYLLTYKNLQVLSVIQKLLDSWYLITSQRIKLYKFGLKHFPFCISRFEYLVSRVIK